MAMTPIRFRTLVDRAGQHCQCDADEPYGCGKTHPTTGDRCYESGDWRAPLVVVPRDPHLPLHEAVGLLDSQLVVMCRPCSTRRANKAKAARAAQAAEQLADAQLGMFDATPYVVPKPAKTRTPKESAA